MLDKRLTKEDVMKMNKRELGWFISDTYKFQVMVRFPEPVMSVREWRNIHESSYEGYKVVRGLKTLQKHSKLHIVKHIYATMKRNKEVKAANDEIQNSPDLIEVCNGSSWPAVYKVSEIKEAYASIIDKIMDGYFAGEEKTETEKILASAIGDKHSKFLTDDIINIYFR